MVTPLPFRLGINAVQGDEEQAGLDRIGGDKGAARTTVAIPRAASLMVRIQIWDEQPWTDLPARLAKAAALRLVDEDNDNEDRADGILIIRRWPTPVVLRRLKTVAAAARTPVLLCTAAPSVACADALRLGIADIIRADMHDEEVLARVALRCGAARGMAGAQLAFGPLLLDRIQRMAWLNGRILRLTALQFELLAALMVAQGGLVGAEALRQAVWHNPRDPGTNRLAVHIHHIRRALQDAGGGARVMAEAGGYALKSFPSL